MLSLLFKRFIQTESDPLMFLGVASVKVITEGNFVKFYFVYYLP